MGKHKKHPEHENLERWLVSYADFITLLFAFFTVLYALGQSDKEKYQKAAEAIQRSFLSAGGIFPLRGAPLAPFSDTRGAKVPSSPSDSGQFEKNETSLQPAEEEIRGLYEKLMGIGLGAQDAEVFRSEKGIKIRLGEVALFRAGSDKIKRESIPFLFELGKRLMKMRVPIQIEGHTDSTSTPKFQSHWELSTARAYNVVQFFIEALHFPPENISIHGFGDTKPLVPNDTPEGRARNRRVEISILTTKDVTELEW